MFTKKQGEASAEMVPSSGGEMQNRDPEKAVVAGKIHPGSDGVVRKVSLSDRLRQ